MAGLQVTSKKLFLIFVLVLCFTLSPSLKAESPVSQTAQTYGTNQTIRIEPQPELGFHYPYYLFIPENTRMDKALYLLVEPNNTGKCTDDFTIHEQSAKQLLEKGYPNKIAQKMGVPLLIPVFPRLASQKLLYTHALDRDSLLIKDEPLQRIDLQLLAMVGHAQKLLRQRGMALRHKVLLNGFSASGDFVNRFTLLHPEHVKAVACGGIGSMPILPFATLESEKLIYPIGVHDLKELTGDRFHFRKYKKIPQYIYQGNRDYIDDSSHRDAYGPEEARLAWKVLHDRIMPERWEAAKYWYHKAGVSAQFVLYYDVYHEIREEMLEDIVRFFQANLGQKFVPIQPNLSPAVKLLEKVHIKDILLPDSEKIPEEFSNPGFHFILSIADWIAQEHIQLRHFNEYAGFAFELIEKENGQFVCEINQRNLYANLSTGKGDFQGKAVRLNREQLKLLQDGKSYTLRPKDQSDVYRWVIGNEVSFVWRVGLKELKILGAYWEEENYIKGFKADKPNSFFIETTPFASRWIYDFCTLAGSSFTLLKDDQPITTARIYRSGSFQTHDGKEIYGFWATIPAEDMGKVEPKAAYKLKPTNADKDYQWLVGENVSLAMPRK